MAQKRRLSLPGGNYEFLCGNVPERFVCSICTNVLGEPHLTECCGQHFCNSCLLSWLRQNRDKICPYCRTEGLVHILNKSLKREINELQIRCTNREKGCEWVGELGTLQDHLRSDKGCDYVKVRCTNSVCRVKMERRCLAQHMENECVYRQYECEYCGHVDTFKAITMGVERGYLDDDDDMVYDSHYTVCDHYPLNCPNECGVSGIMRKDMTSHRKTCPRESFDCPYKQIGCTEVIMRKDMESHMVVNTQRHMMWLLRSHQELQRKYGDLAEKNRELAHANWKLQDQVRDLEENF